MSNSYIKGFLKDILLHLIAERGESYGYELVKMVEERTQGVITLNEGALYPVLHQLEHKGLLVSEMRSTGSRPRKYYRIAIGGEPQKALANIEGEIEAYLGALNAIFKKPAHG